VELVREGKGREERRVKGRGGDRRDWLCESSKKDARTENCEARTHRINQSPMPGTVVTHCFGLTALYTLRGLKTLVKSSCCSRISHTNPPQAEWLWCEEVSNRGSLTSSGRSRVRAAAAQQFNTPGKAGQCSACQ
jgi:hypothetical protein